MRDVDRLLDVDDKLVICGKIKHVLISILHTIKCETPTLLERLLVLGPGLR